MNKYDNELKSHGFRWSPKASAWQRQLTDNAVRVAQSMACLQPTDEKKLQSKEQEATSYQHLHHAEHHQNENFSDMHLNEILSFSHCYEQGKGRRRKISSEYER